MHGRKIASFIVRPGAGRSGRSRILLRAAVGCALVLVVTGRGGPSGSSVSMAQRTVDVAGRARDRAVARRLDVHADADEPVPVRFRRLLREGRLPDRGGRCHRTDPRSAPGRRDAQRGLPGRRRSHRPADGLPPALLDRDRIGRAPSLRPAGRARTLRGRGAHQGGHRAHRQPRLRGAGRHRVAPVAVRRPREPASTCAPPTSPCARRAAPPRTTRSAPSWPRSSNVERSRGRSSSGATSTAAARAPPSAPGPGPTAPPARPRDSSASPETARSCRPRRRSCRPSTPTTTSCWSARISPCGPRPRTLVVSGSEGNQRARPSARNVPFPRKPPDLLMAEQPAIAGCPR